MASSRIPRVGFWLALITALPALGHDSEPRPTGEPGSGALVGTAGGPTAAVESFHAALARGDRDAALLWLAPEVVVFESGEVEMSRDEYAASHLAADIDFVAAVRTEVLDRQAQQAGEAAWVLTRTRTTGRFHDRQVDLNGVETMVLRRAAGQWQIVHVHWSSHATKGE